MMSILPQDEALFGDLFELEHVFEMLDEWATAPNHARLDELCSEQSFIRRRVRAIADQVEAVEIDNGMIDRHSHQFNLLSDLDALLAEIEYPSELQANMGNLKQHLQSAQMIADDLRVDRREPAAKNERRRIAHLIASNTRRYGDSSTKRKTYDKAIRKKLDANPQLSVTEARRLVAKDCGVVYKTVERNSSPAEKFKK